MGLISKLFGRGAPDKPAAVQQEEEPADVRLHGELVIRADQTLPITGRGVVVTGELMLRVDTGDTFDVTHRGTTEEMRVTAIMINQAEAQSAERGTTATLLLNTRVRIV